MTPKVGYLVRINTKDSAFLWMQGFHGREGVVKKVSSDESMAFVFFIEDGAEQWFRAESLEDAM